MGTQEQDIRLTVLRDSIRSAFPSEPYTGKVTVSDDFLADPDMVEEKELHDALLGQRWTDVPTHLIRRDCDGYLLLTDEAFPTFLAAWLMYSLEDMDGENQVREFLAYSFETMRQFRLLSLDQRLVVRSLLSEVKERDPSKFVREHAAEAVALIDRGGY